MKSTIAQTTAPVAAVAATGYSWIGAATEISMLLSAMIGIVVGIVAIWWNVERAMAARKERKKDDSQR